ncbi:hypothetical protein [Pseudoalteromonas peptidolytica]|uniref:hypothetical protein n=1 Tax=Pseudoalteromonas peptidolytica TaxID=61150 RepID=UPI00298E77D3|nr:hypothetical protein [Pseudoalteromonas peptidolytica]MDW7548749.1 hypothetical protein [Pseudoalteromonas peptidolytica]
MAKIEHEKWGRFVDTEDYGQVLVILNQDDGSDDHSVWLITRYNNTERIEFCVPFGNRIDAKMFLDGIDALEAQRRVSSEIGSQAK